MIFIFLIININICIAIGTDNVGNQLRMHTGG